MIDVEAYGDKYRGLQASILSGFSAMQLYHRTEGHSKYFQKSLGECDYIRPHKGFTFTMTAPLKPTNSCQCGRRVLNKDEYNDDDDVFIQVSFTSILRDDLDS